MVSRLALIGQSLVAAILFAGFSMVSVKANAELVNGEEMVDPTAPFFLRANGDAAIANTSLITTFDNYEVSSILIRSNLKMAIINSQRVSEGDRVGNAEVVNIESNVVTINLDGELKELKLHGGSVKTVSNSQR
ncbi:MAG: hypothetical protein ACI934_001365 [Pseudohongiellaceae bacterium]